MPSGSDAEYIPLVISKVLNGADRPIVNIVTCNEEVGSGTLDASGGRFFSPIEPIPGYTSHMEGGAGMSDPVQGLAEGIETFAIPARHPNGDVVDAKLQIEEAMAKAYSKGATPILHTVYGSKTGICQDKWDWAAKDIDKQAGLFVVDACQGRMPDAMTRKLLAENKIVLITGSKFFRGPPFSGACLVPATIMDELKLFQEQGKVAKPVPRGLNTFLGKAEIPRELSTWRDSVEDN